MSTGMQKSRQPLMPEENPRMKLAA